MEPIETICPICDHQVTKIRQTEAEVKNNIVCINESYLHYIDTHSRHTLIKHPEQEINKPEERFKWST